MPAVQTSPWNTHATAMMGDVCAPLVSILRCCVCLLRAPSASDHVCTALRGASCASCSTDTPCCQELGLSRHPRAHLSARLPARPSGTPVPAHASHARSCVLHRSTRQRRRPAPEPSDTKRRGFGDGGTALVTLGDAQAPSQSCGAASFYLERRARPITPSLCDAQFCWGRRCIFTGATTRA